MSSIVFTGWRALLLTVLVSWGIFSVVLLPWVLSALRSASKRSPLSLDARQLERGTLVDHYMIHAVISPDGRLNTDSGLPRMLDFQNIYEVFGDHGRWRWVVATIQWNKRVCIMDLWQTVQVNEPPFVAPYFVENEQFRDADHAIGYVVLHLC